MPASGQSAGTTLGLVTGNQQVDGPASSTDLSWYCFLFQSVVWAEGPVPGRCRNRRGCAALEPKQRTQSPGLSACAHLPFLGCLTWGQYRQLGNREPDPDNGRTPEVPVLFRLRGEGWGGSQYGGSASPAGSVFEVPIWGLLWGTQEVGVHPSSLCPASWGLGSRPAGVGWGWARGC